MNNVLNNKNIPLKDLSNETTNEYSVIDSEDINKNKNIKMQKAFQSYSSIIKYEFDYEISKCKLRDNKIFIPKATNNGVTYVELILNKILDNTNIPINNNMNKNFRSIDYYNRELGFATKTNNNTNLLSNQYNKNKSKNTSNLSYKVIKSLNTNNKSKEKTKIKNNTKNNKNNNNNNNNNNKLTIFNCFKTLVSKKKRRFQNSKFDLDMAYITSRVIAMGYPSSGCEALYRNSKNDIIKFFSYYHQEGSKIYNLCLEKNRIYKKEYIKQNCRDIKYISVKEKDSFDKSLSVGLFPFKDHNPPPIKLILEFCIDISLFLLRNPGSVAAVHCKAGKGRTGTMIICYLIFSELFDSAEKAMAHYSKMRTKNNKGVTIASQIRYINYFEMYLELNFHKPYVKMIPKIIKTQFDKTLTTNMIKNYLADSSYFLNPNRFKINKIKIGPFSSKVSLGIFIYNFELLSLKFNIEKHLEQVLIPEYITYKSKDNLNTYKDFLFGDNNSYYFIMDIKDLGYIDSDTKFEVKGLFNFYFWVNFWYSTVMILNNEILSKNLLILSEDNFINNELVVNDQYCASNCSSFNSNNFLNRYNDTNNMNAFKNINNVLKNALTVGSQLRLLKLSSLSIIMNTGNLNVKKINNSNAVRKNSIQVADLCNFLESFNSNSDIHKFINKVNNCLVARNLEPFDSKNIVLKLNKYELDKFKQKDSVADNFCVEISYELVD